MGDNGFGRVVVDYECKTFLPVAIDTFLFISILRAFSGWPAKTCSVVTVLHDTLSCAGEEMRYIILATAG